MEVDEITVPSPDFPAGLTFGPVTLEDVWEGALDLRHEVPVTMTPRCRRFLGIRWYPEIYRARGVFHVTRDRITFRPTAPASIERATSWRRFGYWLLTRASPRRRRFSARSATNR